MRTATHDDMRMPYIRADKYDAFGDPVWDGKHLDPRKWENAGEFDQDDYYDGDAE